MQKSSDMKKERFLSEMNFIVLNQRGHGFGQTFHLGEFVFFDYVHNFFTSYMRFFDNLI